MLIDGTDRVYMLDRNNAVFHIQRLRFPRRKDLDSDICDTLVDGVGLLVLAALLFIRGVLRCMDDGSRCCLINAQRCLSVCTFSGL